MKEESKKEELHSIFKKYDDLNEYFKSKQKKLDAEVRGMMLIILETKTNYLEGIDMRLMLDTVESIKILLDLSCVDHKKWCNSLSELLRREGHCFQSLLTDIQETLIDLGRIPSDYEGLVDWPSVIE